MKSTRQIALYLIVGICTTLINIVSYWFFTRFFTVSVMLSTALAWTTAVLFAFFGNKWLVFQSHCSGNKAVLREFFSFLCCRIATGAFDFLAMGIFVDVMEFPDMVVKVVSNILVIIGNFIASKYLVFKKSVA